MLASIPELAPPANIIPPPPGDRSHGIAKLVAREDDVDLRIIQHILGVIGVRSG